MNPVPVPIGILVFLGIGVIIAVVGWINVRGRLAAHRSVIVALQHRVDQFEKVLAPITARSTSTRDATTALRRQVQTVEADLEELRTSIAPRALKVETGESLPAATRRRRKKQGGKTALERVASDEEIIEDEGDDE